MAKGQKCPLCGLFTLQPQTVNYLKCSNPECRAQIPKDTLGK